MSSFKEKCQEYFDTTDFYEILKINRGATEKEIKKAYHKLSLLVHPDRVDENQKELATEKFKVLGRIHSVLQDENKRKIYDDCGEFDDEGDTSFNWMDYWRSMFKKIELSDIQKYEQEYIGSDTEKRDINRAYVGGKGNMDHILESVPFSNCASEDRYKEVVREMIDKGEVPEFDGFFNESKQKAARRHKKWQKEKELAEKINVDDLQKELEENMKKRAAQFSSFLENLENKHVAKKRKAITAKKSGKKTRAK
ncbi:unnamed protein product [Brassicogethes aeneus]|uniref:J domain-containing protein n=1 Tax=Brassicogethes aeneus TaxID=1431903 RepID=A0A9P0BBK1_BRAAE|nr:unnamed protein product [Brassicogethes aeneus]